MDVDNIDESIKKYEELKNKKSMFKLKRYENNLLKELNKYFANVTFVKQIKEQKNEYCEKIAKENIEFEQKKEKLRKEKEEAIKKIDNLTNTVIQENKKKYENLFNYLNKIKNDKDKLIEYFKNPIIL
jgi:thiamine kinase-like enzyme